MCAGGGSVSSNALGARDRTVLVAGCLLVGLSFVVACVVVLAPWSPGPWLTGDTVILPAAGLAVAGATYAAVRRPGQLRRSFLLLGVMMALNAVGGVVWASHGSMPGGGSPSFPAAQALYLLSLPCAAAGIALYPMTRGLRRAWRPVLLDGLVLGSSLFLLGAVLGLSEVSTALSGSDAFAALLYPVTDALLTSLVLVLMLRSVGGARLDAVLVGVAFAALTVADNSFSLANVRGGHDLDSTYQLGYVAAGLLVALAGLVAATFDTSARVLQRDLSGPVAPLLPDLIAFVALAVCLVQSVDGDAEGVLAATVLLLTGLRQVAVTTQNRRLRRDLEQRVADRTEELRVLTEEHQRLNSMKQEFVSAVSHELRTPLTAIRGSLEMLADGDAGELPPLAGPVVAMAARGSERLARLVDDIIDVERLETGTFGFQLAAHDLHPVLAQAAESLAPLARDAGVRLVASSLHVRVTCDRDRLTQALVNLVGNALKFTPAGGSVWVGAELLDTEVRVSVADTGRGIPPEELDAVFDRFHQVDPDDARQKAGSGLGLSITRGIIEAHDGRIWVESTPGEGSTFLFTLPRSHVVRPQDALPELPRLVTRAG